MHTCPFSLSHLWVLWHPPAPICSPLPQTFTRPSHRPLGPRHHSHPPMPHAITNPNTSTVMKLELVPRAGWRRCHLLPATDADRHTAEKALQQWEVLQGSALVLVASTCGTSAVRCGGGGACRGACRCGLVTRGKGLTGATQGGAFTPAAALWCGLQTSCRRCSAHTAPGPATAPRCRCCRCCRRAGAPGRRARRARRGAPPGRRRCRGWSARCGAPTPPPPPATAAACPWPDRRARPWPTRRCRRWPAARGWRRSAPRPAPPPPRPGPGPWARAA